MEADDLTLNLSSGNFYDEMDILGGLERAQNKACDAEALRLKPKKEKVCKQIKRVSAGEETISPRPVSRIEASKKRRIEQVNPQEEQEAASALKPDTQVCATDVDSARVAKRKYISLTAEEDPLQFHAKPRDLSRNALKRPHETLGSDHIFSGARLFANLGLHPRLVNTLGRPNEDGGLGLEISTRVQSAVIPLLVEQPRSVLMKSQTGSGKTLAYLLPVLHDLLSASSSGPTPTPLSRGQGTRVLIIAPTRELCTQIHDTITTLTKSCVWLVSGCVFGGERRKSEKARLRKGVTLLCSTPGRLLDHARSTESFRLNNLRWVILDEADRLLDMGFEQPILEMLSIIRGVKLPGLREKNTDNNSKGGSGGKVSGPLNLDRQWRAQAAAALKVCGGGALFHVMASATLSRAVAELALPVMGGGEFSLVDADAETVERISSASDLLRTQENRDKASVGRGSAAPNTRVVCGVVCFDDEAEDLPSPLIKEPMTIAESGNEQMLAPMQLKQYFMTVSCKWRLAALVSFLRLHSQQKVVVFFSTCDSVDFHALLLSKARWPTQLDPAPDQSKEAGGGGGKQKQFLDPLPPRFTGMLGDDIPMFRLHGNVPQKVRQTVYRDFCLASSGVLLCTDVAARGLDLPRVEWILQYDAPCETADYVHRIGRTARRGLGGSALLFVLPSEQQYVQLLASHGLVTEALSLQELFVETAERFIPGAISFKNKDEMAAVILQRRLEGEVSGNRPLLGAGRQAFRSFIRAYATHSADTRGIFRVQSLHLGHTAKSFALRDSPTALRNHEDVIGKIFCGEFALPSPDDPDQSGDRAGQRGVASRGMGIKFSRELKQGRGLRQVRRRESVPEVD